MHRADTKPKVFMQREIDRMISIMPGIMKMELNKREWRKVKRLGCLLCLTKAKDFARSQACPTIQHSTHTKTQCFANLSHVQRKTRIFVVSLATPLICMHLCIFMAHSVAICQCESVKRGLSFTPA
jgi:hypothetical protein